MRLIFRTARVYTRGRNLASAMSFLADLQVRGRLFPRQDRFPLRKREPRLRFRQTRGFFRRNAVTALSRTLVSFFNALRELLHRPRQATKELGSSGQSYVLHIVPHFAVADFKLEPLLAGSQSCLSNPQRLDAGPEWEDNTGWSGTSKQVRTRKPFEP